MALPLQPPLGTMTAMTSQRFTSSPVPVHEHVPTADTFVSMRMGWKDFERMLELRGDSSRPRVAYLDGVVQFMSPSNDHEIIKKKIAVLLEAFCREKGIDFTGHGSWTQLSEDEEACLEPDECYVFSAPWKREDHADLAIEVVWTRGAIKKLEIYRRLGIPEVWIWKDDMITIHSLGPQGYTLAVQSQFVPDIDLELLCRLIAIEPASAAIAQLVEHLRGQGA